MKLKLFFVGFLVSVLTFGMIVGGCDNGGGDDNGGGSNIPTSGVQIYQEDGNAYTGNFAVKMEVWESGDRTYLPAGTITNGKLTLTLPASIEGKYLMDMSSIAPPGITVSPSDVKGTGGSNSYYVFDGEKRIGNIDYTDGADDTVVYMYATKAATITGTYTGDGQSYTATYNVTLRAGWNQMWGHSIDNVITAKSDLSGLPSDLKWVLRNSNN
jgi:hypothetical protein